MQAVRSLVNDVTTFGLINLATHALSSDSAICNASCRKLINSGVNLRRGGLKARQKFNAVTVPTYTKIIPSSKWIKAHMYLYRLKNHK